MVTTNDGMVTAYAVGNGREYDVLIDTLAEASDRFWELRKAVFELRDLCESCESEDVHSEEVLEVLERHGA
jgi:hypothetical protein